MTANKMPEMPEAVLVVRVQNTIPNFSMRHQPWTDGQHDLYTADQMRAMYLAGLEAARACVPGDVSCLADDENEAGRIAGHNGLRSKIISSIDRMTAEAQK